MARPRILPLPDEQARPIARGVQAIEAARPGSSNREFLREFVPLVVKVTGELFGAQTFQKLLRQMAPHRTPSSTTVQDAIHEYRSEVGADALRGASHDSPPIADAPPPKRMRDVRNDKASGMQDEAALAAVELGKLHQLEVERLRARAEIMEARAAAADKARQDAVADAIAARAQTEGLQEAVANYQTLIKQLSETIQITQERAAADNRANLLRVDEVRRETREAEERLKAAQSTIALRDQALRNANALGDSLRQQLNELRRNLQVRDE